MAEEIDKKGIIKALVLAVLIAFLCIGILGWQYHRIEKEQIPALEEKIEKRTTQDALDKFMQMRINQDEAGASRYLTEGGMEQKIQGGFILINNFASYEILQVEKLTDGKYRFVVKIYQEGRGDFIEVISLIKILDKYYIDSIQIAG